ncbi:hypothetical protein HMPREF3038_00526 [Akkermansia sp. KLE1797]|nr:hypothetical protein HMPREF3038_00526 [Akkermansia sp. KLE1797]KXU55361.1 hypothetical protein HMPREF3039_00467 [Akkermansia sp. KLE1798]
MERWGARVCVQGVRSPLAFPLGEKFGDRRLPRHEFQCAPSKPFSAVLPQMRISFSFHAEGGGNGMNVERMVGADVFFKFGATVPLHRNAKEFLLNVTHWM